MLQPDNLKLGYWAWGMGHGALAIGKIPQLPIPNSQSLVPSKKSLQIGIGKVCEF